MWGKFKELYAMPLLFLSITLNFAGLASIVDGVVVWTGFFADLLNVYRTTMDLVVSPIEQLFGVKIPNWLKVERCPQAASYCKTLITAPFSKHHLGLAQISSGAVRVLPSCVSWIVLLYPQTNSMI